MPETLMPEDVVAAAATVETALRQVVGRDWSVQAGPLEWDVERTITHMIGATAKYTLYLASRHTDLLEQTQLPCAGLGRPLGRGPAEQALVNRGEEGGAPGRRLEAVPGALGGA